MVLAATPGPGQGIIHFSGALVEPVCEFSQTEHHIASHCVRNGKIQVQRANINAASDAIAPGIAQITTSWLNPDHHLAIINVSYN
ncbi:hypothetical protein BL250_04810 [Erwinia sp. OLTSP20]|nr:hypothetical protein BV501_12715 [Erwinia sp. OAMSP11]PIJ68992.1 hypothetical protein BK416_15595 [Erwinia sp. OLSSP12]PIJ80992.1 hypothetical protein BLD46_13510 [Erwinia sp. OLMTSP26]PIJ83395.1 hypothetical protein BLD49_13195 [Erwinia sp. OLMDSP33]PIJ84315.1 hypothetical protein BLD47_02830 [Erwinia sp. OLCASP19]PIJ92967.1 hypothetical protein BL249_05505 [Erwinia sp. OLFS4]PIJ94025.1 hypothetical protein BL250_04810 [Erwinia sp. OLTSP20]